MIPARSPVVPFWFRFGLWVGWAAGGAGLAAAQTVAPVLVFSHLAGPAVGGAGSADGTGSLAQFSSPRGLTVDTAGNVYVADTSNSTVRRITAAGVVTVLAGAEGQPGSADGAGTAARFNTPIGLAADSAGNIYVADSANFTVRRIGPDGTVTTFAGGVGQSGSADGTGTAARFASLTDLAVDRFGNVYVADTGNDTVRLISPSGIVSTLAGSAGQAGIADGTGTAARFAFPYGVAVDSLGNVYVADSGSGTIRKITSGGIVSTMAGTPGQQGSADGTGTAAQFGLPYGVAVDSTGNVLVADSANDSIRLITPAGVVTTLAGYSGQFGSANGTGAAARFGLPYGVAADTAGNAYVADTYNDTIRKIAPVGVVTTLAGTASEPGSADGAGTAARFDVPTGLAVGISGVVNVVDSGNDTIRMITPDGVVTTLAGTAGLAGSADGTGAAARFDNPFGVAADGAGNIYVADAGNDTIRRITAAGIVTTLAGKPGQFGSADATGAAARFDDPEGVAADGAGNVYVADTYNDTIRKITAAGVVSTIAGSAGLSGSVDGVGDAARFYFPAGLAVDGAGNVYVADPYNNAIRKIAPGNSVTTLAGGQYGHADGIGAAAQFDHPYDVAVDGAGNVYVADNQNDSIRKITPAGVVTTVGGAAAQVGDADGVGTAARFYGPAGVAVDSGGDVYVADSINDAIRVGVPVIPVTIATQPLATIVVLANANATVSVVAAGSNLTYQWFFGLAGAGEPIADATGATLTLNNVSSGSAGSYYAVVTNGAGSVATSAAILQVNPVAFSLTPSTQSVTAGSNPTLSGAASGSYRWQFNGVVLPGATGATLSLPNIGTNQAGNYTASIVGSDGSTSSSTASIAVTVAARLINLSSRSWVGAGSQVLVVGFVVAGANAKQVLIRGIGPTLNTFSVAGVLAQPLLTLFDSTSAVIATNTGWGNPSVTGGSDSGASVQPATSQAFNQVYAFSLPAGSADGAMLATLPAAAYTAQVSGLNGTTGVALAELYDADSGVPTSHLSNLSARAWVNTGSGVLVAGFVVAGTSSETILIRGIGPALTPFGIAGALATPQLALFDSTGAAVATNTGWGGAPLPGSSTVPAGIQAATQPIMDGVYAFVLPIGSADCAMVVTLPPGAYTAQVSGLNQTTGVALVEIYDVP